MERYERRGATKRFWEIARIDNKTVTTAGIVGKPGKIEKLAWFDSETAKREYARLVRGKRAAGYEFVARGPDPVEKASAESRRSDVLEARIRDNPDDPGAWLVYADWLLENGDPRGELVIVQEARSRKPRTRALALEEERLFDKHDDVWVGELREHMGLDSGDGPGLEIEWRFGFFRAAKFRADVSSTEWDAHALVESLSEHPSAAFLESLEIRADSYHQDDYTTIVDLLARRRPASPLRTLVIGNSLAPSSCTLGNVGPLLAAYPRLRRLELHGAMTLAKLELPALVDLRLWLGEGSVDVAEVLERPPPRLTRLALLGAPNGDELVQWLVKSPVANMLEHLDLSNGTMTRAGAKHLMKHRKALSKLQTITLRGNYLDDKARAALEGIAPEILDAQQRPLDAVLVPKPTFYAWG